MKRSLSRDCDACIVVRLLKLAALHAPLVARVEIETSRLAQTCIRQHTSARYACASRDQQPVAGLQGACLSVRICTLAPVKQARICTSVPGISAHCLATSLTIAFAAKPTDFIVIAENQYGTIAPNMSDANTIGDNRFTPFWSIFTCVCVCVCVHHQRCKVNRRQRGSRHTHTHTEKRRRRSGPPLPEAQRFSQLRVYLAWCGIDTGK